MKSSSLTLNNLSIIYGSDNYFEAVVYTLYPTCYIYLNDCVVQKVNSGINYYLIVNFFFYIIAGFFIYLYFGGILSVKNTSFTAPATGLNSSVIRTYDSSTLDIINCTFVGYYNEPNMNGLIIQIMDFYDYFVTVVDCKFANFESFFFLIVF
jgi:hypothetical protein